MSPTLAGVRVVLDLELFFNDKRRKCYYYIDFSRCKIVGDVCIGIKSSFDIGEDISLEINGCYVPEEENVRVLYNEDVIRVVDANGSNCVLPIQNGKCDGQRNFAEDAGILSNTSNDKKIRKLDTQEENVCDEYVSLSKPKKRKKSRKRDETKESKYCEGIEEMENIRIKRKNVTKLVHCSLKHGSMVERKENEREPNVLNSCIVDVHEASTLKEEASGEHKGIKTDSGLVLEHEGEGCENMCGTEKFTHVQSLKLEPDMSAFASSTFLKTNKIIDERDGGFQNGGSDAEDGEYLGNSNCKRKRRRKKRKLKSTDNCFVQHITEASVVMQNPLKTPKHIKFVDEDEEHGSYGNNNEHNGLDNNTLSRCIPSQLPAQLESSNMDNKNSIKNEANKESNANVPIADNISIVTENSDICSNFVIQTSTTPLIFECKRTNRVQCAQSVERETESDFSKYPLLHGAPKANDIIVFKKLKMDSNYCPSISQYISAKVLQVSDNDSLITLRIINGHEELKEPKGKFSLDDENEAENPEEITIDIIEINLTDLLDVRLLFP